MRVFYTIALLSIALIILVGSYVIKNPATKDVLNSNKSLLLKNTEIIKFESESELTTEYHLWLKIETPKNYLDELLSSQQEEGIPTHNLIVRGFSGNDPIPDDEEAHLPLSVNKNIYFAPLFAMQLAGDYFLSEPKISPKQIDYNTQFYTQVNDTGDSVGLFIHLESGIKQKDTKKIISVSLTHQSENISVDSHTLPPFNY